MKKFSSQYIAILLTIFTFFGLCIIFYFFVLTSNHFFQGEHIETNLRFSDILIGITIYLKTSIDFAIFIAQQMKRTPGLQSRIAIEIGTAVGNGLGTFIVLIIWIVFKQVPLLMACMMFVAALVLLRMAEDSLTEFLEKSKGTLGFFPLLRNALSKLNHPFDFLIEQILPHPQKNVMKYVTFQNLLFFSFRIPLILGLDDFAGYIPLFTLVNVFGFSIGVFFGHMILNLLLFASPNLTIRIIKQPIISVMGSLAFLGLGIWGIYEIFFLLKHLFFP